MKGYVEILYDVQICRYVFRKIDKIDFFYNNIFINQSELFYKHRA